MTIFKTKHFVFSRFLFFNLLHFIYLFFYLGSFHSQTKPLFHPLEVKELNLNANYHFIFLSLCPSSWWSKSVMFLTINLRKFINVSLTHTNEWWSVRGWHNWCKRKRNVSASEKFYIIRFTENWPKKRNVMYF